MYGFVKVATANIETKIGNVFENQKQILDCISKTDADITEEQREDYTNEK